jgi:hypothetical protein
MKNDALSIAIYIGVLLMGLAVILWIGSIIYFFIKRGVHTAGGSRHKKPKIQKRRR